MSAQCQLASSRFEFKYLVDERCARGVRDFVRGYLQRDRYALQPMSFSYPIYSLYLDTPGMKLYRATVEGHKNRYKLRLRYYDHEPHTPVFFEVKRRVHDVIIKLRTPVQRHAVSRLLAGACPRRDDLHDPDDAGDYEALLRFCEIRAAIEARPKVVVYYEREAWVGAHDSQLRVSFDRQAMSAHYDGTLRPQRWFNTNIPGVILELKFNDRFPVWMQELVENWDLYRTTMAKYVHCVDQLPWPAQARDRAASVWSPYERCISIPDPAGSADRAGRVGAGAAVAADRLLHGTPGVVDVHADAQRTVVLTDVHLVAARAAGGGGDDDDAAGRQPAGRDRPLVRLRDDQVP
jgi:hypothetical protein